MKPLGDAFIRMITMIITILIFCTVVTGIAGMQDLKKVGRVGGKALLYFEIVSTIALVIGLVVGNVVRPGSGFNVNAASLDAKAVADYAGQAKAQSVTEFLMHIIPTTVTDAFAKGDILQVVFISILFGFGCRRRERAAKPIVALLESLTQVVFRVVNILMLFAPIGCFRSHGLHHRQIRAGLAGAAGQADRHILGDLYSVCAHRAGRDLLGGGIQHCEVSAATSKKKFCWCWPPVRRKPQSPP